MKTQAIDDNPEHPANLKAILEDTISKLRKSQAALLNMLEDLQAQNASRMKSEEKYKLLFNEMTEGFALHEIICDEQGIPVDYRFLEVNPVFESLTGLKEADLIGHTVQKVFPDTEQQWTTQYRKVAIYHKPVCFIQFSKERNKFFEVSAFSTKHGQLATIFKDVTEQIRTEQALRESENKFRNITEQVTDMIFMTDRNGFLLYVSPASKVVFGYEPYEMIAERFTKFLQKDEIPEAMKKFRFSMKTGRTEESLVLQMIRKDGKVFTGELRSTAYWEMSKVLGSMGLVRDITEEKRLQEEIRRSHEQLQQLHQHLIEAREEERTLISREIHDELGQALSALKLDLGWIHNRMVRSPEVREKIEGMINLVSDTIKDVQRISTTLRPGLLDDLGLSAACEWYCEEFEKRSGLVMKSRIEETEELPISVTTALFRILQEGLTNIIRHAAAKHVLVTLEKTNQQVILQVKDDGVGISYDLQDSPASLGLMGIRERIRQFAGTFDLISAPGRGTTIRVKIPLENK